MMMVDNNNKNYNDGQSCRNGTRGGSPLQSTASRRPVEEAAPLPHHNNSNNNNKARLLACPLSPSLCGTATTATTTPTTTATTNTMRRRTPASTTTTTTNATPATATTTTAPVSSTLVNQTNNINNNNNSNINNNNNNNNSSCNSSACSTSTSTSQHLPYYRRVYRKTLMPALIVLLGVGAVSLLLALGVSSAVQEERQAFDTLALDLMGRLRQVWEHYVLAAAWVRQSCAMDNDALLSLSSSSSSLPTMVRARQHLREIYHQTRVDQLSVDLVGCIYNVSQTDRSHYEQATAAFVQEQIQQQQQQQVEQQTGMYLHNKGNMTPSAVPPASLVGFHQPVMNNNNNMTMTTTTSPFQRERRPEADFYFPLHLVEPRATKLHLLDADLWSPRAVLQPYVATALQTGQPVLSSRRVLVKNQNNNDNNNVVDIHDLTNSVNFEVGILHPGSGDGTAPQQGQAASGNERIGLLDVTIPSLLQYLFRFLPDASLAKVDVHLFDSTDRPHQPDFLGAATSRWRDDEDYDPRFSPFQACDAVGCYALQRPSSLPRLLAKSDWYVRRTLNIANREWTIVVVAERKAYQPQLGSVYGLAGALLLTSLVLAACLAMRQRKEEQHTRYKVQTEAEKAAIRLESAQTAARNERELNDYIAHEVRNPLSAAISACSFVASAVAAGCSTTTTSYMTTATTSSSSSGVEPHLQDSTAVQDQETLQEDVQTITTSLMYINDLLRNMLDMHRAESNELKLQLTMTDVRSDILQPVEALLYRRDTNFQVQVDCPPDLVIRTDKLRLKQIILNLARNAVKFVEAGFVRLGAHVLNDDWVRLFVEDSGPGVPESKKHQMFRKFQDSLDSMQQGTGIGLALCQKLIDLLGGEIRLDNDYHSGIPNCPGARFVIDLPTNMTSTKDEEGLPLSSTLALSAAEAGEMPPVIHTGVVDSDDDHQVALPESAPIPLSSSKALESATSPSVPTTVTFAIPAYQNGPFSISSRSVNKNNDDSFTFPKELSILFVDDNLMLRKLFQRSIKRCFPDWKMETAASGEAAIRLTATETFDVIFMDQYMASVDKQLLGTETVRAMRSNGTTSIICGLSANDMEDAFLKAGANAFLIKPFPSEKDVLKKEVARILATGKTTTGNGEGSDSSPAVDPEMPMQQLYVKQEVRDVSEMESESGDLQSKHPDVVMEEGIATQAAL